MIRLENVLKRSLQDVWKMFWRRLEDVLKKSWRCLEDVLKTSWRRLEDVLKMFLQDVLKKSWRRMTKRSILVLTKTSWKRLLKTKTKDFFKTSLRRLFIKTNVCWVIDILESALFFVDGEVNNSKYSLFFKDSLDVAFVYNFEKSCWW